MIIFSPRPGFFSPFPRSWVVKEGLHLFPFRFLGEERSQAFRTVFSSVKTDMMSLFSYSSFFDRIVLALES